MHSFVSKRKRATAFAAAGLSLAAAGLITGGGTAHAENAGAWLKNASSHLCLAPSGASTANGTPIIQWPCDSSQPLQQWFPSTDSHGYSTLVNYVSWKCLTTENASTSQGATLVLWDCNNGYNQIWDDTQSSGSTFVNNYGLAIDDPNFSTGWGTRMVQWGRNNQPNQHWDWLNANEL